MKKSKLYDGTRFSADTIREAIDLFDKLFNPNNNDPRWIELYVTRGSESWDFDSEDEFLADYRQPFSYARYGKAVEEGTLALEVSTSTTIRVEATARAKIQAVFESFEKRLPDSQFPPLDALTPRTSLKPIGIHACIITLPNLQRLAQAVFGEYAKRQPLGQFEDASVYFALDCSDASTYEGSDIGLFANDSVLASKRVVSARMSYSYRNLIYRQDECIRVRLYHADSAGRSMVEVEGTDAKWAHGTLKMFEEIVDGFAPQNRFAAKNRRWIQPLLAIGMGAVIAQFVVLLLSYIVPVQPTTEPSLLLRLVESYPLFRFIVRYFLFWLLGSLPASAVMSKLLSLWPSVEIQVGPEHKLTEKRRRAWMIGLLTLGIFPLLVQFVYDVVKYIITGGA